MGSGALYGTAWAVLDVACRMMCMACWSDVVRRYIYRSASVSVASYDVGTVVVGGEIPRLEDLELDPDFDPMGSIRYSQVTHTGIEQYPGESSACVACGLFPVPFHAACCMPRSSAVRRLHNCESDGCLHCKRTPIAIAGPSGLCSTLTSRPRHPHTAPSSPVADAADALQVQS